MRSLVLTPFLCLLSLAPGLADDDDAVLLVKREACFVHALPAWPKPDPSVERVVAPGHELLHTRRADGHMVRLGEATGTVAVNTRRISFRVSRILGVVADAERLYVLLWRSGRIFDRAPEEGAELKGGRYELHAFWLEDGARLQAPALEPAKCPATAPPPSLERGALRLVSGGVSCYGTTVRYEGPSVRTD